MGAHPSGLLSLLAFMFVKCAEAFEGREPKLSLLTLICKVKSPKDPRLWRCKSRSYTPLHFHDGMGVYMHSFMARKLGSPGGYVGIVML